METILSKSEYNVFMDVFKRIDGEHIVDFDSCIFRFANISTGNFLKELPKVVNILAGHKNEIEYKDFIRSLSQVVDLISEIYDWKFCLNSLSDLCESLSDTRAELLKRDGHV